MTIGGAWKLVISAALTLGRGMKGDIVPRRAVRAGRTPASMSADKSVNGERETATAESLR